MGRTKKLVLLPKTRFWFDLIQFVFTADQLFLPVLLISLESSKLHNQCRYCAWIKVIKCQPDDGLTTHFGGGSKVTQKQGVDLLRNLCFKNKQLLVH